MTWNDLKRAQRKSLKEIVIAARPESQYANAFPGRLNRHFHKDACKALALRKIRGLGVGQANEALKSASRMNLFEAHRSPIKWWYMPKASGRGHRKICSLPPRLKVSQIIAKDVLHALHTPRDYIFDWPGRGGCPAATARLREVINGGARYILVADVRDCYESFNPQFIYDRGLLPSELVQSALDSRQFRYHHVVRDNDPSIMEGHTEHPNPQGLLQGGAASSALLAIAFDDLADHLPTGVTPIVYSDNIVLACRRRGECDEAEETLSRFLLNGCSAGSFSLRIEKIWFRSNPFDSSDPEAAGWDREFEQFGYWFQPGNSNECKIHISEKNIRRICKRIEENFGEDLHKPEIWDDIFNQFQRNLGFFGQACHESRELLWNAFGFDPLAPAIANSGGVDCVSDLPE